MLTRAWSPPEEQTIGVVRKGSRALQHLPASADAFVWLRLYQQEMLGPGSERAGRAGVVDAAPSVPPSLTYDATWMVFTRVNRMLGANWTLHALRHSAAKRMLDWYRSGADVQARMPLLSTWLGTPILRRRSGTCMKARELHQLGEKPQVAWSAQGGSRRRHAIGAAS